jgi:hypothetical protein
MLRKFSLRLTALMLTAAAVPVAYLAAQDNQNAPSVAEAARRARQQKEAASSKPTAVLTNDNLPAAPAATSNTNGAGQATASSDTTAPEDPAGATEGEDAKNAEMDGLKKEIVEKQQSLDILEREVALERDNFYRKQDYQRDAAGKEKLDSMQAEVQTRQDELSALKAKLTAMAGADALKPAAPATPPAGAVQAQP